MKKIFSKNMLLMSLMALAVGTSCHAQKYVFKSDCNCVINKGDDAGIDHVTICTYQNDPDMHSITGYYYVTATHRVDTFSLVDFSPKNYQCYPCTAPLQAGTKYVLYLHGKTDKEEGEMRIIKNEEGKIKIDKSKLKK